MSIFRLKHRVCEEAGEGEGEGGGGGGGPSAPAPAEGGDWTANLSEDLRGYVGNKGFEGPEQVVDSYRNLEKLMGAPEDRLVKLPDNDDTEGWSRVYNKLGRPADPKEYDLGDTVTDENFGEWYRSVAHELGMTQGQAKALVDKMTERGNEIQAQETMDARERAQETEKELRTEWGAAYEENLAKIDRAATELGMSNDQLSALREAMGPAEAMRFVYGLGQKMGEDVFVDGGDGTGSKGTLGAMTPEQAQSRIKQLSKDADFVERFQKGETKARDEWNRLHRWAHPD